jgi:cation diffusion facilitator CzcD-associated flavoprotein CzcO
MNEEPVKIIGAGVAGLAVGGELARARIPNVVLERAAAIASSWRGRYDRLRLNTSRFTSKLQRSPYSKGTGLFPSRDEMVTYLERYAQERGVEVRLGVHVERIDRDGGGWSLRTSQGEEYASQVVVATGYEHTPWIPDWPGRERFCGRLMHAAEYRNAEPFRNVEALIVGPGCSGMEIAFDLAEGGASRVDVAVRTQPNILLRQSGPMPGDLPAMALLSLPPWIGDAVTRFVRRRDIGDLSEYGLVPPEEGPLSRLRRDGKAPAIVDREVIDAIKQRRIRIVAGLQSFGEQNVELADGTQLKPDVVIAATGYTRGLAPLVGHLGLLDERELPRAHGGPAAAPGLRFIGYTPQPGQIGLMGREARRIARAIRGEMTARAVA